MRRGFSSGSDPSASAGDTGLIPGLGRTPGAGNDNPLKHSCLESSMDRGAWWAIIHGVTKQLDMTEQLSMHANSKKRGLG